MLPQVNIIRAKNGDFLSFYEAAGISGVLTVHGVWDEVTILIAKALIDASNKKPIVFDIGANMGTFAIPLSKHIINRNGVLHAFEPQRIVYYQLCGNIFLNRMDNVFAHNIALSTMNSEEEIAILNYKEAWNIGAYSLVPGKDGQEKILSKDKCQFIKLDDFIEESSITLMKIDVEGMELEVINGGISKIINSGYPPILFESNKTDTKANQVFDVLIKLGYQIVKYAEEDCLAQHPLWESEIELSISNGQIAIARKR